MRAVTITLGDLRSEVARAQAAPQDLDRVVFLLLRAPEHERQRWLHYALDILDGVRVGRGKRKTVASHVVRYALAVREVLGGFSDHLADEAAAGAAWALAHWLRGSARPDGLRVAVHIINARRPGHVWVMEGVELRGLYLWPQGAVLESKRRHVYTRPMDVWAKWHTSSPVWKRSRLKDLRRIAPARLDTLPLFSQ